MKFIIDGTEMIKKRVGGSKYGYLYLPRAWIKSEVSVVRHALPEDGKKPKMSKGVLKMKQFAKLKLKNGGYRLSDEPINVFGKILSPLLIGYKGKRMVTVSGLATSKLMAKDIDSTLSAASNVLYIVISKKTVISSKAQSKIKSMGNVQIWRF